MLIRRLMLLAILCLWCGGVGWYWWHNVPLAATNRATRTPASTPKTLTPSDEMPMVQQRWKNGPGSAVVQYGPMEFWSFPECKIVRTLFSADDEIIRGPLLRTQEVMIRRRGRLLVFDSETGAELANLPDVADATEFAMVPQRHAVLIGGKQDVHLYEIGREKPTWTIPMRFRGGLANGFFVASPHKPGPPGSISLGSSVLAIRLETGEPDSRFDHLGKAADIRLSRDGKLAIVCINPFRVGPRFAPGTTYSPGKVVICDARTGVELWKAPVMDFDRPAFHADDQEIHGCCLMPDRQAKVCRWRASDGAPLPDLKPGEHSPLKTQSADGRFGFYESGNEDTVVRRTIDQLNNFLGRQGIRSSIRPSIHRSFVREVATGAWLGPLPAEASNLYLKKGGLVSIDRQSIRYYDLPPHRDYWWLARWIVLPPALVWGGLRLARLIRARWSRRRLAGAL